MGAIIIDGDTNGVGAVCWRANCRFFILGITSLLSPDFHAQYLGVK